MILARMICAAICMAALVQTIQPASAQSPESAGLPNPFFAMDTGTKDAAHQTPEAQAKMVKELGYDGIGWSPGQVPQMLAALDREGLKMFTVYIGVEIDGADAQLDPIRKLVGELKGRDTIIWLYVTNRKYKPSAREGDEGAVAVLQKIAGMAKADGLRVALYPHTGLWLERVQDAVRIAKQVDRENLGVTFNLCHCLKVGDEGKIPELLAMATPHLFVVTINGADHEGNWDRLIQPLGQGLSRCCRCCGS